jgi:type IV secretory pathway TraG/TraD family ATPase VirD4
MLLKPLMIFRNAVIRERTSGSDFKMAMLKGIRNPETRRMEPVTVYSTANTKSTKFVSRMFIEIALRQTPGTGKGRNGCPLLVVMDVVGQMLKIRSLVASLSKTKARNMSFLLLCNSLYNFENVYGKEMLEDLWRQPTIKS